MGCCRERLGFCFVCDGFSVKVCLILGAQAEGFIGYGRSGYGRC